MSYDSTNLFLMTQGGTDNSGVAIWQYSSSADAATAIDAAGHISDGGKYGMKVGDIVLFSYLDATTANRVHTSHRVASVDATTGAVNLNQGVALTSATTGD